VRNSFDEVRTGNNGMYRIRAAQGDVLQIKALGMISKDTVIGESNKMHIRLEPDGELLEEVRVIAQRSENETVKTPFGEKKKAAVGYSTRSVVTGDDIRPDQIELWQILQKMPGVVVEDPGGSNPRYKLRRTMEITIKGTTYPALVIDGMVYEQTGQQPFVNVQQIESVKVLNSLSATNRYGQLAAFGAIVIETKNGPAGEPVAQQEIEEVKGNKYTEQVLSIETAAMNAEKPDYIRELEAAADFESAKSLYHDILRQNNLPSVSFFLDVGRYFRKWNAEFSNQVLSNITEIAPNNTKALKSLAYTLESFSEDELATPVYERIVNLQPAAVQSYLDLARNYKRVGEYQMSATLYKQMVANSIRKVDFNDVGVIVFNEFKQLIARHKSKIDFSDIPNELMKVGFKKDIRLVVEWNDPMADFELQFVTPDKKYFPYVHNLYGDQEMLKKEMEQGFSVKEFDIGETDRGAWIVNVKYSGDRDELNPTIMKYTLYRNFGLPDEERIIKTVKLQDFDGKVTLDSFVY
jgi:tetratricopeptide (TPR) repeat protein